MGRAGRAGDRSCARRVATTLGATLHRPPTAETFRVSRLDPYLPICRRPFSSAWAFWLLGSTVSAPCWPSEPPVIVGRANMLQMRTDATADFQRHERGV